MSTTACRPKHVRLFRSFLPPINHMLITSVQSPPHQNTISVVSSEPTIMSTVYYQSRTAEVYGITAALLSVATFAVILRLFARRLSKARFWTDDWSILAALVTPASSSVPSQREESFADPTGRSFIMASSLACGSKLPEADWAVTQRQRVAQSATKPLLHSSRQDSVISNGLECMRPPISSSVLTSHHPGFHGEADTLLQHLRCLQNVSDTVILSHLWPRPLVSIRSHPGRGHRCLLLPRLLFCGRLRVQPGLVLLGQEHPRRLVHQRHAVLPVERSREPVDRPHDPEHHLPHGLGPQYQPAPKGHLEWSVCARNVVRIRPPPPSPLPPPIQPRPH